jgi:hypothetical protein
MCGRQCSKKLWQTVYDPGPAEEPLPGTVKGIGIEVGIQARLLWPDGVLVETNRYDDYTATTIGVLLRSAETLGFQLAAARFV